MPKVLTSVYRFITPNIAFWFLFFCGFISVVGLNGCSILLRCVFRHPRSNAARACALSRFGRDNAEPSAFGGLGPYARPTVPNARNVIMLLVFQRAFFGAVWRLMRLVLPENLTWQTMALCPPENSKCPKHNIAMGFPKVFFDPMAIFAEYSRVFPLEVPRAVPIK